MSRIEIAVILVLIALLVLQGIALLGNGRREPYHLWSGLLALAAATFTGLAVRLFAMNRLVIIPAFGALLVDGPDHLLLQLLLVLLPIGGAILIESARAARGRKPRTLLVLGAGLLIGIFAAARVQLLSPEDSPVPVYAYDMWSPLPLCWITFCVVQWVAVVLQSTNRVMTLWLGMVIVVGLTLVQAGHPVDLYLGPETALLWRILLIGGWVTAFAGGLGVAALTLFGERLKRRQRWLWAGCAISAFASLKPLLAAIRSPRFHAGWAVGGTLGLLTIFLIIRIVRLDKKLRLMLAQTADEPGGGAAAAPFGETDPADPPLAADEHRSRIFALVLLPTLLLVLAFTVDLLYLEWGAKSVDLIGLAITALILIELTSEGPLRDAGPTVANALWGSSSFVRRAVGRLFSTLSALASRLRALAPRSAAGESWLFKTLGKLVAVVAVLVVVQEIPNRGRTLIYPFSAHSLPADKAVLGEVVSERVSNRMAALVSDLGSEVLVADARSDAHGEKFAMIPVDRAGGLETALQDDSVMIGPVKLPLGAILTPLRAPLQSLFGARLIRGSVHQDSEGDYQLLVNSSMGETWRISTGVPTPGAPSSPTPPASASAGPGVPSTLLERADDLAYLIVTSDPAWTRAGMTANPEAFKKFSEGLESWRRFEAMESFDVLVDKLENAIQSFDEAVALDPHFAVAHYRLGLALRSDNQPSAAIRAFEAAINADPGYGEAQNALASTLFDFQSFVQRLPAPLADSAEDRNSDKDVDAEKRTTDRARQKRARQIWQDLVAAPGTFPEATDRGSAYLGLCRSSIRTGFEGWDTTDSDAPRHRLRTFAKALYFCARADAIYREVVRGAPRSIASTRAEIATDMASALRFVGEAPDSSVHAVPNGCDADRAELQPSSTSGGVPTITWKRRTSRLEWAAAPYFRRARALLPDDPAVACNAALSAAMRGDERPLRELVGTPAAGGRLGKGVPDKHAGTAAAWNYLGDEFVGRAHEDGDPLWYRAALDAYDRSLQLEPRDPDALNAYAYAFWVWRYSEPNAKAAEYQSLGTKAERSARLAVRLAAQGTSKSSQAVYASTLGEVLMALGRPHEAIRILREAVHDVPEHSLFDEIRWDLARAYSCATQDDRLDESLKVAERCDGLLDSAAAIYEKIRQREKKREDPVFTTHGLLDATVLPRACSAAAPTSLNTAQYEEAEHRDMMAVEVPDEGWTKRAQARVHIWGNEVDAYADQESGWRVLLNSRPVESHHEYFAQLVTDDDDARPLSIVYTFRTHAAPDENLITLQIDPPLVGEADQTRGRR